MLLSCRRRVKVSGTQSPATGRSFAFTFNEMIKGTQSLGCCGQWRPGGPSPLSIFPKDLWGTPPQAVMESPRFAEKEKRERLEGEGTSSRSSEAPAHPDTCKSPTAGLCFRLRVRNSLSLRGLP